MSFSQYLEQKNYRPRTVHYYTRLADEYLKWLQVIDLPASKVSYADLLEYLKEDALQQESKKMRGNRLCAIRHLYCYLQKKKKARSNPAQQLFIRGVKRRLPHDLIPEEKLLQLFDTSSIDLSLEDQLILSLLIFQALRPEELTLLKAEHFKLGKLQVFIPATRRSNARWLELDPGQVDLLTVYLKGKTGRLFFGRAGGAVIHNRIAELMRYLNRSCPQLRQARQIRASRIALWLKALDLRQVQHRAGHRFVSSTEHYQVHKLEDLHRELARFHPLRHISPKEVDHQCLSM